MKSLKRKSKISRCNVCQRRCLISEGKTGFCLTRKNINGKIISLLYGQTTGIQIDPIEKKPFYHFKPGSLVATLGSYGCNFRCKQCLNWQSSWGAPATVYGLQTTDYSVSPKEIADKITSAGHRGIAFSYNEPVIWFEFARDIALEFKRKLQTTDYGLRSTVDGRRKTVDSRPNPAPFALFVTNGSWTKETIDQLSPFIDGANIDLKGFSKNTYLKQGAYFGEIPQMAVYAQKQGIFLELTTLLIPTINDNPREIKKMCSWIAKNLGPDTPWHLSQFDPTLAPDKEFQKLPFTSVEELEKAAEIGKKAGLNHIYVWAPSSHYSRPDTICPKCRKIVIKRLGWQVTEVNITEPNLCRFCNYKLNVVL